LCLHLGHWRTVGEMLADLTAEEYAEWKRIYDEHQWGDLRTDQRTAAQVLWMAAAMAGAGSDDLPDLFYPYFKSNEQRDDDLLARAKELKERAAEIQAKRKL
jgi:hypothetical protein